MERDKTWEDIHILRFEEGRSATEISTAIRLMAAAAREWGPELGFITCSLNVKQGQRFSDESELGYEGDEHCADLGWSNLEGADSWQK